MPRFRVSARTLRPLSVGPLDRTAAGEANDVARRHQDKTYSDWTSVGPRDREAPATPLLLLSEASGRRRAGDDDVSAAPALLPQQQQVRPLTPGHATRAGPRRIRARNSSSLRGRRRRALPILRNSVFLLLGSGFTSAIPLVTSQVASDRFSLPRSFPLGA
jgi:hypothetical protein